MGKWKSCAGRRCSPSCISASATCARVRTALLYAVTDEDDGALLRIEPAAAGAAAVATISDVQAGGSRRSA